MKRRKALSKVSFSFTITFDILHPTSLQSLQATRLSGFILFLYKDCLCIPMHFIYYITYFGRVNCFLKYFGFCPMNMLFTFCSDILTILFYDISLPKSYNSSGHISCPSGHTTVYPSVATRLKYSKEFNFPYHSPFIYGSTSKYFFSPLSNNTNI